MSMGFLIPEERAAVWRGPMVMGALGSFSTIESRISSLYVSPMASIRFLASSTDTSSRTNGSFFLIIFCISFRMRGRDFFVSGSSIAKS